MRLGTLIGFAGLILHLCKPVGASETAVNQAELRTVTIGKTEAPYYSWVDSNTLLVWHTLPKAEMRLDLMDLQRGAVTQVLSSARHVNFRTSYAFAIQNGYIAWFPWRYWQDPDHMAVARLPAQGQSEITGLQLIPWDGEPHGGPTWMSNKTIEAVSDVNRVGMETLVFNLDVNYFIKDVDTDHMRVADARVCGDCQFSLGRTGNGRLLTMDRSKLDTGRVKLCELQLDKDTLRAVGHIATIPDQRSYIGCALAPRGDMLAWAFGLKIPSDIPCVPPSWVIEIWVSSTDGSGMHRAFMARDAAVLDTVTWLQWLPDGRSVSIQYGDKLMVYSMPAIELGGNK